MNEQLLLHMQGVQEELEVFQESFVSVSPLIQKEATAEQEDLVSLMKQLNIEEIEKSILIARA